MRLLHLCTKKSQKEKEKHETSNYAWSSYVMERCHHADRARVILDSCCLIRHSSRWGRQNFKSILMEGQVLGHLEGAGSILSRGEMVKEDEGLKIENPLKDKAQLGKESKCKRRSGSRGWEGLL